MRNVTKSDQIITRRAVIVGGFKISIFLGIIARLINLQILNGDKYKIKAEGNSIRLNLLCPDRGKILDCNGQVLAENTSQFRLIYDGAYRNQYKETIPLVGKILDCNEEQHKELLTKYKNIKINGQAVIIDTLTWDQLMKLELNNHKLVGVEVMEGSNRYYPFANNAAHLLGYVGYYSGNEVELNPLLRHPDFRVGKDGVEKSFEHQLRGEAGLKRTEVNAKGAIIREISTDTPQKGQDTQLTIDIKLQNFISEILPDTGAAAVVVDVNTGAIKAMVSKPNFDPNELVKPHISSDYWNKIITNKGLPLMNKAIASHYPPGSIFKIITILSALEAGIKPETIHTCPGYYMLGNREFRCAKKEGHGAINMRESFKYSCNVYMFNLAKKVGIERIYSIADQLGLGTKTGIDLPSELDGVAPNKRWKRQSIGKDWTQGDTLNSAIGQGFTLSTPLQIAMLTARIANNGRIITPKLVTTDLTIPEIDKVQIKKKHIDFIKQAMFDVVNAEDGTGRLANLFSNDYQIAGKTATSQVVSKKQSRFKTDLSGSNVAWESKNHALFTGFAPFSDPKYAISLIVEHGGNGSTGAAPFVREIFRKIRELGI